MRNASVSRGISFYDRPKLRVLLVVRDLLGRVRLIGQVGVDDTRPRNGLKKTKQAFRLQANAPRGKRVLRGLRGGKVSKSLDSLTHLKVSRHALSPLAPLVPLVPLSDSLRSSGAQWVFKTDRTIGP